jgi:hypothetical protein
MFVTIQNSSSSFHVDDCKSLSWLQNFLKLIAEIRKGSRHPMGQVQAVTIKDAIRLVANVYSVIGSYLCLVA